MTLQARTIADSFAAGSFAISAVLTSLRPTTIRPELHTEHALTDSGALSVLTAAETPGTGSLNLLGAVSQPSNPVLWALLCAVVITVGLHMTSRIRHPLPSREEWLQALGLLLAALWPWVLNPMPLVGLGLAAVSFMLLGRGIVLARRQGQRRAMVDLPIAFIAGWLLMAATSALGMVIHARLGIGLERAVLIGLLVAALSGAWGQLRLDGAVTFSLALIWAMIGFAAATAGASITIATACVLGISALAVVLVRVTT